MVTDVKFLIQTFSDSHTPNLEVLSHLKSMYANFEFEHQDLMAAQMIGEGVRVSNMLAEQDMTKPMMRQ